MSATNGKPIISELRLEQLIQANSGLHGGGAVIELAEEVRHLKELHCVSTRKLLALENQCYEMMELLKISVKGETVAQQMNHALSEVSARQALQKLEKGPHE